jgi:urease accessory protein
MRARASARAEMTASGTRVVALRSEAPLVLRETPDALYLVGGAGGPLGGDDLALDVEVGPGAHLRVRSAGATLAQPGPHGGSSRLRCTIRVGDGASLDWAPEPLVSVRASDHVVETTVDLAASAWLELHDEIALGRADEAPGRLRSRCRVTRDGVPVLAHDLDLGGPDGAWAGPAGIGPARFVTSILRVGPDLRAPDPGAVATADGRAGCFPLVPGAVLWMAVASTRGGARRLLAAASETPATPRRS